MISYNSNQISILRNYTTIFYINSPLEKQNVKVSKIACITPKEEENISSLNIINKYKVYSKNNKTETIIKKAASRLHNLISGLKEEDDEMLLEIFKEESPGIRLLVGSIASGLVIALVSSFSRLCGNDPLGGMALNDTTMHCITIGGIAAIIPILMRLIIWSPSISKISPIIQEYTTRYIKDKGMIHGNMPLLYGMTSVSLEICQQYILLIIGIMGCVESSINAYINIFQNDKLSHDFAFAIALLISCLASSVNNAAKVAMTEKELDIIINSANNAKRYYKMMSYDGGPEEAMFHAYVFKQVAMQFVAQNKLAVQMSSIIGAFDILYAGILWKYTDNLMTPLTLGILIAIFEYFEVYKREMHT